MVPGVMILFNFQNCKRNFYQWNVVFMTLTVEYGNRFEIAHIREKGLTNKWAINKIRQGSYLWKSFNSRERVKEIEA